MGMGSTPSQQNINRFSALDNDTTCCVLAMLPRSSVVNIITTYKWFEVDKYIESRVLDNRIAKTTRSGFVRFVQNAGEESTFVFRLTTPVIHTNREITYPTT